MENNSHSPEIGKIAAALVKAQMRIQGAVKDAKNPFFKSTYADLSSVWEACRQPLNDNEIAVVQLTNNGADYVTVSTMLVHTSGEWIRSDLSLTPKQKDPQGVGSAITYARRYALAAIAGVCPVDDDAEGAMGRNMAEKVTSTFKGVEVGTTEEAKKKKIRTLVDQLGYTPQAVEEWQALIKAKTQLALEPSNYDEIIERLTVLLNEKA